MTIGSHSPPSAKPVTAPPDAMAAVAVRPIQSERTPPTGCKTKIVAAPATSTVKSGVRNKSNSSGTRRCSRFSSHAPSAAASTTEITPPRPGTSGVSENVTFASAGWLTIAANTPPKIGEPPKTCAALQPTKRFMPQKTALPNTESNLTNGAFAISGASFR